MREPSSGSRQEGGSCRSAMRLKLFFPRRVVVLRASQWMGTRISERGIWLARVIFLPIHRDSRACLSKSRVYHPTFTRYKYMIESKLQYHNPDHSSHCSHNTNHVGGGGSSSIGSGRASRSSRSRSSVTSVRGRRAGNLQRRSDGSKTRGRIGDHAISSLSAGRGRRRRKRRRGRRVRRLRSLRCGSEHNISGRRRSRSHGACRGSLFAIGSPALQVVGSKRCGSGVLGTARLSGLWGSPAAAAVEE